MRLKLKLIPKTNISQKHFLEKYNYAFRSFILDSLKDTKYKDLHNDGKYSKFCFGNIFPENKKLSKKNAILEGELYNIIISSPFSDLIQTLFFKIREKKLINIGDGSFGLKEINIDLNKKIESNSMIECVNIISITKNMNGKIKPVFFHENPKEFKERLNSNLVKKYRYFVDDKLDKDFNVLENIEIKLKNPNKKSFSIPIPKPTKTENNRKTKKFYILGSSVLLEIGEISEKQNQILNFCFDLGFGEKNSYGIGFMIRRYNNV